LLPFMGPFESRKQGGRIALIEAVLPRIHFPEVKHMRKEDVFLPEALGKESRVILTGRSSVLIEGHKGLFSFESAKIRVRAVNEMITVTGKNLMIEHFGTQDLLIRGQVDAVSAEEEGA